MLFNSNNSIKHQSFVYTQLNDQTVLFQSIQFSMWTKLTSSKYGYVLLTIQLNVSHLFTELNDQTVLLQSFVWTQFIFKSTQIKFQTVLFDPQIGPYQVLPLRARVDLGVMKIKAYSALPKAPALLEPHHHIV